MEKKKKYDIDERTLAFLKSVINFLRAVKKDFAFRLRICRKEAKESSFCL
jgi:hypothetical protein